MSTNVVAIVGRPNVGKSTLFNRCIGARRSIVDDTAGVTRDRIYEEADWAGHKFLLVDTGGIILSSKEVSGKELAGQVYNQVKLAVEEADVIVFVVDGKIGLLGADQEVAGILRKANKPVVVAVNKIDEPHEESNVLEFFGLGLGQPQGFSALRGSGGVGDLLDQIVDKLPKGKKAASKKGASSKKDTTAIEEEDFQEIGQELMVSDSDNYAQNLTDADQHAEVSVAVVGKPNVGKSSIINALCGTERSIVSKEPGTTRDAIDTRVNFKGNPYLLIDTAGIRRKSKVQYGIEAFSVVRSLKAITRCDAVALVIDVTEPITEQDQKIAARIEDEGKAAVIVFNKWDLSEQKSSQAMNELIETAKSDLRALSFADVVFTSAKTKQRTLKILEAAKKAYLETRRRIGTGLLNQIVNQAVGMVPPPSGKRGKRLRIYYTTQVSVAPPTFVLFTNDQQLMTESYKVYLERKLREAFGFAGTPLRLVVRSKRD